MIYEGKYEDALEALESATDLEPVEPYMWNNLGMAYEHLDRLDEAREAYEEGAAAGSVAAKDNRERLEGVESIATREDDEQVPALVAPVTSPMP